MSGRCVLGCCYYRSVLPSLYFPLSLSNAVRVDYFGKLYLFVFLLFYLIFYIYFYFLFFLLSLNSIFSSSVHSPDSPVQAKQIACEATGKWVSRSTEEIEVRVGGDIWVIFFCTHGLCVLQATVTTTFLSALVPVALAMFGLSFYDAAVRREARLRNVPRRFMASWPG